MNKRDLYIALLVVSVMTIGILGITNPGHHQAFRLFDNSEGKMVHNYFIFSVYQQMDGYETVKGGKKYRVYKRYIGIARSFVEISDLKEEQTE